MPRGLPGEKQKRESERERFACPFDEYPISQTLLSLQGPLTMDTRWTILDCQRMLFAVALRNTWRSMAIRVIREVVLILYLISHGQTPFGLYMASAVKLNEYDR